MQNYSNMGSISFATQVLLYVEDQPSSCLQAGSVCGEEFHSLEAGRAMLSEGGSGLVRCGVLRIDG
jgi:hypothetical protein